MKRPGVIRHVMDASAVMAMLLMEAGGDTVAASLSHGVLSAVNLAEAVAKLTRKGLPLSQAIQMVRLLQLQVIPFDEAQAITSAALFAPTVPYGLSLGDRACLALAQRMNLPVLTADQAWRNLDIGIEIKLIR
jgi:ribonuclease VapC